MISAAAKACLRIRSGLDLARMVSLAGLLSLGGLSVSGCAMVPQKDREFLSDPIMQRAPDAMGSGMEGHNLPRREGSSGGSSGSGGGCGC